METDSLCLLPPLSKTRQHNFSWPFSLPYSVVYCDKSYKKLHSCHFSRDESSRKIFLRHHCQSCESLWKKEEEEGGEKREEETKLVNRAILDLLYIQRNQKRRIKRSYQRKKKGIETKNRNFDLSTFLTIK